MQCSACQYHTLRNHRPHLRQHRMLICLHNWSSLHDNSIIMTSSSDNVNTRNALHDSEVVLNNRSRQPSITMNQRHFICCDATTTIPLQCNKVIVSTYARPANADTFPDQSLTTRTKLPLTQHTIAVTLMQQEKVISAAIA